MAIPNVFKQAGGWVKSHPGYSIGGAGGAVFIGVLLYKQEKAKAKNTASGASSGMQPSSGLQPGDASAYPSYDYLYGFYSGDQQGGSAGGSSGGSAGGSSGGSSSGFPKTGTVRATTGSQYDQQYGGVELFATPATNAFGGHNVATVPFGSSIQLLSQTSGTPYSDTSGGSSTYYLTPQGYINSQDVTGIGGGARTRLGIIHASGWQQFMSNHLALWNSAVNEYGMVN